MQRTQHFHSDAGRRRVALVYFPWRSQTVYKFLNQVLSILNSISDSLTIIGGNTESLQINEPRNTTVVDIHVKMHDVVDITPRFYSKLLWAYKAILCQILDAIAIMRNARDIDVVLFYMSYPHEALPLITAKALGKRTCIVQTRSHRTGKGLLSRLLNVQDSLIYRAADAISPESDSLVSGLGLTKYRPKLTAEGYRYVDPRKYNVKKGIGQRSRVGFISRLEEQKGILGFMEAAQRLIETGHADIAFFVGGDGSQRKVVQAKTTGLKKAGARIEYLRWIPEEDFCDYLNDLRLLVLPTTARAQEGLPTIVVEAMACGTPVLTTPVAAIPDVVQDEITGFFLEDTSAECIASGILRVLSYEDIENVIERAHAMIADKFSFDNAIKRWRCILYGE